MFKICTMVYIFAYIYSPANEKEVKEKLQEILSQEEFSDKKESGKNYLSSLREKIIEFFKELYEKLNVSKKMGELLFGKSVSPLQMQVLQIVALVLLVLIIVLIIYFIFRNLKNSKKIKQDEDLIILNTIKDPDVLFAKAMECKNSGDYNQALRYLYIGLLVSLNKINIIKINKSKTNKQYLMEVQNNKPDIYNTMSDFTYDFNIHWYGKKPLDETRLEFWLHRYNNLVKGEVGEDER